MQSVGVNMAMLLRTTRDAQFMYAVHAPACIAIPRHILAGGKHDASWVRCSVVLQFDRQPACSSIELTCTLTMGIIYTFAERSALAPRLET